MTPEEIDRLDEILEKIRYPGEYFNASDDDVVELIDEVIKRVRDEKR